MRIGTSLSTAVDERVQTLCGLNPVWRQHLQRNVRTPSSDISFEVTDPMWRGEHQGHDRLRHPETNMDEVTRQPSRAESQSLSGKAKSALYNEVD